MLDRANLHAALQAAAALLEAADETLVQAVDVDVGGAGFVIPDLRKLRLEHRHQRTHLRLVEQSQRWRAGLNGFAGTLNLRGLLPSADDERATRCEQRVVG